MERVLYIIKNPIFLGIIAALITFTYFYFEKKNKNKNKNTKKSLNIVIPGIVGSLVWFLTGVYFDSIGHTLKTTIPIVRDGGQQNVEFLNNILSQAPVISHSARGNLGYNKVTNDIPLPNIDVFMDFPNF